MQCTDYTTIHDCPARAGKISPPKCKAQPERIPGHFTGADVLHFISPGVDQLGLSAKHLWPSVNYLLLDKGLWLALAVGLDAANVVRRGAV
jgi:hypothetical protein